MTNLKFVFLDLSLEGGDFARHFECYMVGTDAEKEGKQPLTSTTVPLDVKKRASTDIKRSWPMVGLKMAHDTNRNRKRGAVNATLDLQNHVTLWTAG